MCAVTTAVTALIAAASTAVSMQQQQAQAKAQRQQLEYQAQVAEQEKANTQQRAQAALASGEAEASLLRRQKAKNQGDMAANMAASGFAMDSGSNLSLLGEEAEDAAHATSLLRHETATNAWNLQQQGVDAENRAQLDRMRAAQVGANARYGATQSLLGGLGSMNSIVGSALQRG